MRGQLFLAHPEVLLKPGGGDEQGIGFGLAQSGERNDLNDRDSNSLIDRSKNSTIKS